jgi:nucleotide-binding universal stress UspA family protein
MKTFNPQKILIPIDFSETSMIAIEHGAFTAKLFKAEIIFLHVVEKHWEKFSVVAPELRVDAPTDLVNSIEKRLEEIAANTLSKYGVKSTSITSDGNIFSEIIAISKEQNVDLIVMGTHGTSGVVEFFAGSNTYKVVTEAKCPVLSIRAQAQNVGFKNIVLPIDDSVHSRQKVNHAVVMAKHAGAVIHILGLADTEDQSELKKFEMKLDTIEEYMDKCGVICTRKVINGGNQARVTYDYAQLQNADLIVIMTDQDENITGRLLGTYAQQVVNHSKIPVMSIQPVVANTPWIHPY